MKRLISTLLLSLIASTAMAAIQTATLSVPGMTCAACPITIKKALNRVEGVQTVEISYQGRSAVVQFDDALTSAEALAQATADVGYPATIRAAK